MLFTLPFPVLGPGTTATLVTLHVTDRPTAQLTRGPRTTVQYFTGLRAHPPTGWRGQATSAQLQYLPRHEPPPREPHTVLSSLGLCRTFAALDDDHHSPLFRAALGRVAGLRELISGDLLVAPTSGASTPENLQALLCARFAGALEAVTPVLRTMAEGAPPNMTLSAHLSRVRLAELLITHALLGQVTFREPFTLRPPRAAL